MHSESGALVKEVQARGIVEDSMLLCNCTKLCRSLLRRCYPLTVLSPLISARDLDCQDLMMTTSPDPHKGCEDMRCDSSLLRGFFRGHLASPTDAEQSLVFQTPIPLPSVAIRTLGLAYLTQPYEAITP